jgi:hypothetical protein
VESAPPWGLLTTYYDDFNTVKEAVVSGIPNENREEAVSEQSVLELMKNWGYYSLAKPHPDSPGHSGLLAAIREEPTGKHFDVQKLHLRLRDEYGRAKSRTFIWISPLEGAGHVCPGTVTLEDRLGKQVEFFTFGGSLEMTLGSGEVVYSLRSPAPVLDLTMPEETVPDQLASETEELLGRIGAKWEEDEGGFSQRLAEVDSLQFYLAALGSILHHYQQAHVLEESHHEFIAVLRREREWLIEKSLWPAKSLVLEDLLAPR